MKYPTSLDLPQQDFLYKLRDCHLDDNELVDEFYDTVIEFYDYSSNYYIILAYGIYDVPIGDLHESDDVYEYLLCCICPMNLSKAALSYDTEKRIITDRISDWIVELPMHSFLWPSFNDRSADIHEALFYTKNIHVLPESFISNVIGTYIPSTHDKYIRSFRSVLPEKITFEEAMDIQNTINELHTIDEESVLDESTLKKIFKDPETEITSAIEEPIPVASLFNKKKISIGDITVTADADTDIQVETVNGRKCIVIPLQSGMTFNDICIENIK